MNEKEQQEVWMIKGIISGLPEDSQNKIKEVSAALDEMEVKFGKAETAMAVALFACRMKEEGIE